MEGIVQPTWVYAEEKQNHPSPGRERSLEKTMKVTRGPERGLSPVGLGITYSSLYNGDSVEL